MIYVNQKQLEQVEYLIEQSSKGYHVLFDLDTIRTAFGKRPTSIVLDQDDMSDKEREVIEKHIENLILQPSLISKRAYLENLGAEMFVKVVRTYFSIVENNIFESNKVSH